MRNLLAIFLDSARNAIHNPSTRALMRAHGREV
jgi:hypothetical protein